MSGCVQWWPARTAIPSQSRICATSCGCTSSTSKLTMPARRSAGGPKTAHARDLGERVRARTRRARARAPRSPRGRPPRRSRCATPKPYASAIAGVPASNLYGSSFQLVRSSATERIISPPRLNGCIASSSSRRPHSAPDAARPAQLVRREREEVAAERLHVDLPVRRRLGGVDDHDRALLVRPRRELLDRVDRAERVRDEVVRDDLHVATRGDLVERVELELAEVVDRDVRELGARSASRRTATGTKFEWCSSSVITTTSPGPRLSSPHE